MHNPQAETRFVELMTELFQLDEAEALDFGIYRVIRRHNKEVRAFLGEIITKGGIKQLQGGALSTLLESAFTASDHELLAEAQERKTELEEGLELKGCKSAQEREAKLAALPKINKPLVDEYRNVLATLEAQQTGGSDRTEVLNHLYNFFARHYQDGDFIVERRFSKNGSRYIQSRGEDTEFHWATEDMYYIKSGDTFTDYQVTLSNGEKLTFSVEPDTLNHTRTSLKPTDKAHYEVHAIEKQPDGSHTLVLSYLKGAQSDKHKNDIAEAVGKKVKAEEAEVKRWLNHFIARNQSDFFIHKKLADALTGDLDIFIKTDVLNTDQLLELNDLPRRAIQVGRIVKQVGLQIIDFLATLEDFQKQLWEKKKLVFTTRYVITLDRIAKLAGEDWLQAKLPTILKAQKDEWKTLGLGEFKKTDDCKEITPGDLASAEKTRWLPLPVDTGLLKEDFKWALLAAVTQNAPLDDSLDGVAIHSDNWQALNTLQDKYREQVKCVYIDPPYNTGGDGFPYKDAYRHASWMAMIENRSEASFPLLKDNSAFFSSIGDDENTALKTVLSNVFSPTNFVEQIIWAKNTNKNQSPTYSTNHEYVHVFSKSISDAKADFRMFREPKPGAAEILELVDNLNAEYPSLAEVSTAISELFSKHKKEFKENLEKQGIDHDTSLDPWKGVFNYKNAEYRDADGVFIEEKDAKQTEARLWVWREDNPSMPQVKGDSQKDEFRDPNDPAFRFYKPEHPTTGKACPHPKRGWAWPLNRMAGQTSCFSELANNHRICFGETEEKVPQVKKFLHETETQVSKSIVIDYTDGEKQLTDLFGKTRTFPSPKPTTLITRFIQQTSDQNDLVLDFFAGSGTTLHSAFLAAKDDEKPRKTLLIDSGQHFENILMYRAEKCAFSLDWKSGKPKDDHGPGLFMRIQTLEQYEDTLENLDTETSQQNAFAFDDPAFSLRYRLNRESKALYCAIDSYRSPWGYRLKRALGGGESPSQPVDLVESLIYLLGLQVNQLYREDEGVVITGQDRRGRTVTVLFRDCAHANSEGWIISKLAAHDAQQLYTNLPAELSCKGSDRFHAIEAVFATQFGRGGL